MATLLLKASRMDRHSVTHFLWTKGLSTNVTQSKVVWFYRNYYFYSAPDKGAEYCDDRVSVYLEIHVRSFPFFVHVTHGRDSVLLWQCCDMLSTSGFMDDVISNKLASDNKISWIFWTLWALYNVHDSKKINRDTESYPTAWDGTPFLKTIWLFP